MLAHATALPDFCEMISRLGVVEFGVILFILALVDVGGWLSNPKIKSYTLMLFAWIGKSVYRLLYASYCRDRKFFLLSKEPPPDYPA